MFGSVILDVALALVLILLFVSLVATAVLEAIEAILKLRARDLERGIRELLREGPDGGLAEELYKHPLVFSLFRGDYRRKDSPFSGMNLPSYIPPANFADALLAICFGDGAPLSGDELRAGVDKVSNPHVRAVLLSAVDRAGGDALRVRKAVEDWYNSAMDRVSGWYKRRAQVILFMIGVGAAATFNLDVFTLGIRLLEDQALRESFVALAERTGGEGTEDPPGLARLQAELRALGAPVGWFPPPQRVCETGACRIPISGWFTMISGWVVVGFATTLGAPFWFDLLNKFMVIRSTVKPREKSIEEGSEDRR